MLGLGFGLSACGNSQDISDLSKVEKSVHSDEADARLDPETDRNGAEAAQALRDDAAADTNADATGYWAIGTGYQASLPNAEPTLKIDSQQRMIRAELPDADEAPTLEAKPAMQYRQDLDSQD